jgi:hypothetical protein
MNVGYDPKVNLRLKDGARRRARGVSKATLALEDPDKVGRSGRLW